jgi:hypothetical protein
LGLEPESPQNTTHHTGKRRKLRVALSIAGSVAVVILAAVFGLVASGYQFDAIRAYVWPSKEKKLELSFAIAGATVSGSVQQVDQPIISITGHTNQPCQIELFLDEKLIGRTTTFDKENRTLRQSSVEQNQFEFRQVMLQPGSNFIHLQAKLIRGGRASRPTTEVTQTVEWHLREETDPVIYRLPKKITTQALHVQGSAYPGSSVILSVLQLERGALKEAIPDIVVTANDKGHFEGDFSFSKPGRYFVIPHKPTDDKSERTISDKTAVDFAPNSSSQVVLSVTYDQISIDIQASRPKDDPVMADLLSGHNTLAQFIDREFDLRLNDRYIPFEFRDVVPRITINETQITIEARAALTRSSIFPVRRGNLDISRGYDHEYPLQGPGDTLKVIVNDYTPDAYTPAPNLMEYPAAVWTGARDPVDWNQSVQISLDFNPTKKPRDLFRFLTLSPYELFDYEFGSVFSLLTSFLYAIPVLWLLYLFHKYPELAWVDSAYIKRLRRVSNLLLALILLPGVQHVAGVLSSEFFEGWSFYQLFGTEIRPDSSDNALVSVAGTLATLLISIFLLTIVRIVTRHPAWRIWLARVMRGITYACLLNLFLTFFYWRVWVLTENSGESFIPTVIITLPVLIVIALCIRRLASPAQPPATSFIYWFAGAILLAAMAYPAGRSIYSLSSTPFSTVTVTTSNVNNFFGMIQDFLPYILLVGVVRILKSASSHRQNEIHPFIFDVALLLFSCYVIGTTANWFIVPIPFILALILYPRLLAAPAERVNAVNFVKPLALRRRRWFLDRVFDLSLSKRLLSSVDQMEKNIASGDLAPEEFLKRRQKLETYAEAVRQENDFHYELKAKDLALSLGPCPTNWDNGVHALKRGFIISLPFLLLYLLTFLIKQIRLDSSFVFLWTVLRIITFVLDWALYAFFFGYFFNQLQGESGLKKGLRVALVVIACLFPVWLTSGSSLVELSATFLRAGQIFLFFTVLGVWAFDYHTFRTTLKEHFSLKRFTQFGDMPRFVAVASVLLTSAGVAFSSVLKGRFLEVVTQLISAIFPEIPRS